MANTTGTHPLESYGGGGAGTPGQTASNSVTMINIRDDLRVQCDAMIKAFERGHYASARGYLNGAKMILDAAEKDQPCSTSSPSTQSS